MVTCVMLSAVDPSSFLRVTIWPFVCNRHPNGLVPERHKRRVHTGEGRFEYLGRRVGDENVMEVAGSTGNEHCPIVE